MDISLYCIASKEKICISNLGLTVSVIYFGLACKNPVCFGKNTSDEKGLAQNPSEYFLVY